MPKKPRTKVPDDITTPWARVTPITVGARMDGAYVIVSVDDFVRMAYKSAANDETRLILMNALGEGHPEDWRDYASDDLARAIAPYVRRWNRAVGRSERLDTLRPRLSALHAAAKAAGILKGVTGDWLAAIATHLGKGYNTRIEFVEVPPHGTDDAPAFFGLNFPPDEVAYPLRVRFEPPVDTFSLGVKAMNDLAAPFQPTPDPGETVIGKATIDAAGNRFVQHVIKTFADEVSHKISEAFPNDFRDAVEKTISTPIADRNASVTETAPKHDPVRDHAVAVEKAKAKMAFDLNFPIDGDAEELIGSRSPLPPVQGTRFSAIGVAPQSKLDADWKAAHETGYEKLKASSAGTDHAAFVKAQEAKFEKDVLAAAAYGAKRAVAVRLDGKPNVKCQCCGLIHGDSGRMA